MLSKDCKNVQFCLVYSNKMVLTGIPSVLSLHAMKSEMAYVFIMPLKSCLFFFFFYPHIFTKLLGNLAGLHHVLLQWEFNVAVV